MGFAIAVDTLADNGCSGLSSESPALEEENLGTLHSITADEAFGRRHVVRMGARAAYYRCQTQEFARAIAHKTRVVTRPFESGELVYVYRENKGKRWRLMHQLCPDMPCSWHCSSV